MLFSLSFLIFQREREENCENFYAIREFEETYFLSYRNYYSFMFEIGKKFIEFDEDHML